MVISARAELAKYTGEEEANPALAARLAQI